MEWPGGGVMRRGNEMSELLSGWPVEKEKTCLSYFMLKERKINNPTFYVKKREN